MSGEKLFGLFVTLATWVATEALVGFLIPLVACKDNLVHVGHDDEIASVHMRCVSRAMFAHQYWSYLSRQPTNHGIRSVDYIPLAIQLISLGQIRFHGLIVRS